MSKSPPSRLLRLVELYQKSRVSSSILEKEQDPPAGDVPAGRIMRDFFNQNITIDVSELKYQVFR